MKTKSFNVVGRLLLAIAIVILVAVVTGSVRVNAKGGEIVRVSTSKQLKEAIKNDNVGTIIFRTQANINVTIKADAKASEKFLIIDAERATVTNKAKFAGIEIISINKYNESVSGNKISLADDWVAGRITVSKKKQVESLTVNSEYGYFESQCTLRKGAKIKNITLVYAGGTAPVESTYNAKKRVITLDFVSRYDFKESITIKLDKYGRVKKYVCAAGESESTCEYNFTYDSNGNRVKLVGEEYFGTKVTSVGTFSGNLLQKKETVSDEGSSISEYKYDDNGRLIYEKTQYISENKDEKTTTISTYEYDEKGRLICETFEYVESGYFTETVYEYNSKGFLTNEYINNSGSETTYTYKYNKAGDKIKSSYRSEGFAESTYYEYDEFGQLVLETYSNF